MNSIDDKIKHSQRRKRMVSDKVRRIEEKGFNPKTLEEEYKRKKLRVNEYFDDREEGE
jgi:hypothetical protein